MIAINNKIYGINYFINRKFQYFIQNRLGFFGETQFFFKYVFYNTRRLNNPLF